MNTKETRAALQFDLGTFEGFNFRTQSAIDRILTADEIINWDHDRFGEAEFWPSGVCSGVALVFKEKTSVKAWELQELDRLLDELEGDSLENYVRIHVAQDRSSNDLASLSRNEIEDLNLHIYIGEHFIGLRKEAAYELYEVYYPEEFGVWKKSRCDGLFFEVDRFLAPPSFWTEELICGDVRVLVITPQ